MLTLGANRVLATTIVSGLTLAIVAIAGCTVPSSKSGNGARPSGQTAVGEPALASPDDVRMVAQDFADTYVTASMQAFDQLQAGTKRFEIVQWALQQKVATATAAFTNATAPNPYVACIDLVILATLKRLAVERHWLPVLLTGPDAAAGQRVLDMARRSETEAWVMARRALSESQVKELREAIDEWVAEHPDQYYVGWVRLSDIASARSLKLGGQQSGMKAPSSVFGLLFIDPLAGLDPVAQEVRSYRMLTERLTYLFMRMPLVYGSQIQMTLNEVTTSGGPADFIAATTKFADATSRFADATAGYPKAIDDTMGKSLNQVSEIVTRERAAAITQAAMEATKQRVAIIAAVDEQQSKLREVISDVRATIADADRATANVRQVTSATMQDADAASARLVSHVRNAVIVVIIVACVVPAVVLLVYRRLSRRLA